MGESTNLPAIVDPQASPVDLAVAGWLAQHSRSRKTRAAYEDTIRQFRAALRRVGADLDSDASIIALTAQAFAAFTSNPQKERTSKATRRAEAAHLV